jgi:hypothetical protein
MSMMRRPPTGTSIPVNAFLLVELQAGLDDREVLRQEVAGVALVGELAGRGRRLLVFSLGVAGVNGRRLEAGVVRAEATSVDLVQQQLAAKPSCRGEVNRIQRAKRGRE